MLSIRAFISVEIMGSLPESTLNLIIGGVIGILGGVLTAPINALFTWMLKKDLVQMEYRLKMIAKQQELLMEHRLEMQRRNIVSQGGRK